MREKSLREETTDGSETSEDQGCGYALSGDAGHAQEERRSQTDKKRSSPGVVSTAKKVVRAVIAGAASGAVQGAVEAGQDATGLGKKGTQARPPQRS